MKQLDITDFLRMGQVKRWHTVETTRPQTLAEHSHQVAVIALEMAAYMKMTVTEHGVVDLPLVAAITTYALFHDAAEVVLGDAPSPAKEQPSDRVPAEYNLMPAVPYFGGNSFDDIPLPVRTLVKVADLVEAYVFIRNHRGPDSYSAIVVQNCHDRLHKFVAGVAAANYGSYNWMGAVDRIIAACNYGVDNT